MYTVNELIGQKFCSMVGTPLMFVQLRNPDMIGVKAVDKVATLKKAAPWDINEVNAYLKSHSWKFINESGEQHVAQKYEQKGKAFQHLECNEGAVLKCVEKAVCTSFTLGKEYKVTRDLNGLRIISNNGNLMSCTMSKFEIVENPPHDTIKPRLLTEGFKPNDIVVCVEASDLRTAKGVVYQAKQLNDGYCFSKFVPLERFKEYFNSL